MKKEIGIFVLLVVMCAVTGFENPRFFSQTNLVNMANIIGLFGIFSLGAGLVIITSGIDLSVGSMIALIGMLLVMALTDWHWAWPLAVLFVIVVAMMLGWAHGVLVTRFQHAAVHCHALRFAAVSWHCAVHCAGHHQGFWQRGGF